MHPYLIAAAKGFALGASLIIAIGAQNAFVIRQGLKRQHVLLIVSLCSFCDAILIFLGAEGFGTLIANFPNLTHYAAWAGGAFLLFYGARSFKAALNPGALHIDTTTAPTLPGAIILQTLAFSLLNPHVYLDTVVLLGSLAAQFSGAARRAFALGAMTASFVWFFAVGFGAAWAAPLFKKPAAWRILDLLIGVIMWALAASLLHY
jgi:L-lysine exporter family protein LysE/ArgO